MPSDDLPRRDARNCPLCGAMGILPLDQEHEPDGSILDPVMLCPLCGEVFIASGMRHRISLVPPDDNGNLPSREYLRAWAKQAVNHILPQA